LEIGLPIVVKFSGQHRHNWFNYYPVRGLVYIYLAVLTEPDSYHKWYASIIAGFAKFAYIYGLCLIGVAPTNFILQFIPRGYPTSVKTQRPESTFWAVVTLISCALNLIGFAAVLFEMFWYHDGENVAQATYREVVGRGHETSYGKALYVYQAYMIRTCLLFFIPLLFAAELEVTPILHGLPELRYLVTKGPLYILVGTILLIDDYGWPAVDFVNYTGYAYLCYGCTYLAFPAVRIIHELFGDRMSPKTRFYPGLYTAFSVWGVVMSLITLVLLGWQIQAYDTDGWGWQYVYVWYSLKVCGFMSCFLAICTELELEVFYEYTLGGVPIHFDFLRNWVSRAFLYLFLACICAEGGDYKAAGAVTLFDLDRALMWTWVVYACVYVVFFIHLVSSAILYKLYIANEAWFQKAIADESLSETTALLQDNHDDEEGGNTAWAQANSSVVNRKNKTTDSATPQAKKQEGMRRFVLQQGGKLVLSPIRFNEEKEGALGKLKVKTPVSAASEDDGQEDGQDGGAAKKEEEVEKPTNFYVRAILYDEIGKCRAVNATEPEKPRKNRPLPKGKKAKEQQLNAYAAYAAQQNGKRIFCWSSSDTIPLVVSQEVSRMGKEAAIDVQVWCSAPNKSAWALAGAEEVQVGEARVALDQLSLGVPGVVQLHAPNSNASGDSRGTLELTISYEPAREEYEEDDEDEEGGGGKEKSSQVGSQLNMASPTGNASIGGGDAADVYESAIDPTSGRKYYFNRATGHRTWNRPVDNTKLSANDKTLANAAL
jgi:hypothetical protein